MATCTSTTTVPTRTSVPIRTPAAPAVDVVIVTYNRYELTDSCLRHLQAQTLAHRVIVVDNGSSDGTPAHLRKEWPGVQVLALGRNRGFAVGSNRGVSAGGGELVVLLNNDVRCRTDFLERLVGPLRDPAVGSVASLMLQPGEALIDSVGLAADVTLAGFPRLHGLPAARAEDARPRLAGPAGTAAAYRRAAWEQVGGLDETIFTYMEDFDLALRLRNAHWESVAATDAVGVHLGSATHGHRSAWQRRNGGFGRGYLLRRYGLPHGAAAARALATEAMVVVGDLVISHDLAALQGRLRGWSAGKSRTHHLRPPLAIDRRIGFRESLALRRGVYARRELARIGV